MILGKEKIMWHLLSPLRSKSNFIQLNSVFVVQLSYIQLTWSISAWSFVCMYIKTNSLYNYFGFPDKIVRMKSIFMSIMIMNI